MKDDIRFEYTTGDSCVKAIHIPTGLSVKIDGRHRHKNQREAVKELERLVAELVESERAEKKQAKWVRTYDFTIGKTASLKDKFYG